MSLEKKTVLITGGASGIGEACCREFTRRGAQVAVVDIDEDRASAVAEEIGGFALPCDVSDETSVSAVISEAWERFGHIDVCFSNAGVAPRCGVLDCDVSAWEQTWAVNVMAHVFAVRCVLPRMLARGSGYLVHTSSIAGILTGHQDAAYAATKHAVVGLAEWLAMTYRHRGIKVSLVAPLGVRTPMIAMGADLPIAARSSLKEPGEVATLICDGIEQGQFLILSDPQAQDWIERKAHDVERWLTTMSRIQERVESEAERSTNPIETPPGTPRRSSST